MQKSDILDSCISITDSHKIDMVGLGSKVTQTDHPMLKALLLFKQSQKGMLTHQLKLAKISQARSVLDSQKLSGNSQSIHQSVTLLFLSHQLNLYWLLDNFLEVRKKMLEINVMVKTKLQIQQVMVILFQTDSLMALIDYDIKENIEFQYPAATQTRFLFLLALVKNASKRPIQAMKLLDQILLLHKSTPIAPPMKQQVEDLLAQLSSNERNPSSSSLSSSSNAPHHSQKAKTFSHLVQQLIKIQKLFQWELDQPKECQNYPFLSTFLRWLNKGNAEQYPLACHNSVKKVLNLKGIASGELQKTVIFQQAIQFFKNPIETFYLRIGEAWERVIQSSFQRIKRLKRGEEGYSGTNDKQNGSKKSYEPRNRNQADRIVESCVQGSYLTKINFGNHDLCPKFVRITDKDIRWADERKEIDMSYSMLKWKHTIGIIFGKVAANLMQKYYKNLEPWQCFSLLTRDRSYDFYCQNEKEVFFWLQGISLQLQKFHNQQKQVFPFYSKGRALWKRTLLKMRYYYVSESEAKKCRNLNCKAIINFGNEMMSNRSVAGSKNE